jgi:two-component system, NarL family, nitrate/nitrite response regulator NarL
VVTRIATVVIEPRLLVREALESLMGDHSYRVVCGVGTTTEITDPSIAGDGPKLVILGAQSADYSVNEALAIRKLWPDSKILLLFEYTSPADFQKLLTSQVDGCVPLSASPETLISAVDLLMAKDVRVMILRDTPCLSAETVPKEPPCQVEDHQDISVAASHNDSQRVPPLRSVPGLSEREAQILNGLVKGHANKVIARACDITEATVKVHMKSILRKIRVTNRTQAAIWALENLYPDDETRHAVLEAAASSEDSLPMR